MPTLLDNSLDTVDWGQPVNWNHGLNQGLVSWWLAVPNRMGFGGDTWRDMCGRNHGTLTNMDPPTDWNIDRHGRTTLEFDDTDDYVKVADGTLAATLAVCTVSAWFRTTAVSQAGGRVIYCERASSGNDIFKLDYADNAPQSDREPFFTWRNDAGTLKQVRLGSVPLANDNEWHHFAVVIVSTAVTLYYDSIHTATDSLSTKSFTNSGLECRIGGDKGDATANWAGGIRDVRIQSVALSEAQIDALYHEGRQNYPRLLNRVPRRTYSIPAAAVGGSIWELNPSGTASSANVWALGP